jgi:ketosteroid isomerase-like protein
MRFASLITLSLGLLACPSSRTSLNPPATPNGAEATVHQLEDEWADAYVHHDAARLASLLSDDYLMTMNLGGLRTKGQYVEMVRSDTISGQTIVRDQERTRVYGDAAVVTYRPTRTAHGVPHVFRTTDVWIYRDDRWQLVARQITDVPAP